MWPSKDFIFTCEHSQEGENILHYLCRNGGVIDLLKYQNAIVNENRYLVSEYNPQGKQCVHIVTSEDKLDPERKLQRLMEWGADINAKEKEYGDTALHIAVKTKNYKLAEWLCQQSKVDIEARNYAQQTPCHLAYERNNKNMMSLLRENGAQWKTSQNATNNSPNARLMTYKFLYLQTSCNQLMNSPKCKNHTTL